jgi:hypothetical protein
MAFYTVMIPPPGSGGQREEIERARLLPESFSWPAFLFGGLWLLAKKLWLWTLVYALIWGALLYLQRNIAIAGSALLLVHWAIGLFLGLEGNNLIVRKLARQGWRLADVVEARDLPEAERRYFERALANDTAPPRREPSPVMRPLSAAPAPIIGLFPEALGR